VHVTCHTHPSTISPAMLTYPLFYRLYIYLVGDYEFRNECIVRGGGGGIEGGTSPPVRSRNQFLKVIPVMYKTLAKWPKQSTPCPPRRPADRRAGSPSRGWPVRSAYAHAEFSGARCPAATGKNIRGGTQGAAKRRRFARSGSSRYRHVTCNVISDIQKHATPCFCVSIVAIQCH
jgi:hypothetical protein